MNPTPKAPGAVELRPCPFCGGAKVHFYPLLEMATHRSHPFVVCHQCSAKIDGDAGDYSRNAQTAIAAWNTRAPDARAAALEEAWRLIDTDIQRKQPALTRRAQRLAETKKPCAKYAIQRADMDARMSCRDKIRALIEKGPTT